MCLYGGHIHEDAFVALFASLLAQGQDAARIT